MFLDEVGNLALETQQMLLRAIQERRYRPVGDKADRNFNVRIIAATNEDLEVSVNEKRFRQDLLYRLHDFGITVPPLRDCQEDIMPLAEFFRDMANRGLSCLAAQPWRKPDARSMDKPYSSFTGISLKAVPFLYAISIFLKT